MSLFRKGPPSIRTRISGGFLALLAVAFLLLGLGFNFVVGKYIESQARTQIGIARDNVAREVFVPHTGEDGGRAFREFPNFMRRVNGLARRAEFLTQVQALVIDEAGALVYPAPTDAAAGDALAQDSADDSEKSAVYDALTEHELDLGQSAIRRLADGRRIYYMSAMPIRAAEARAYTLVLYMDMTGVTGLHRTLNLVLFSIIAITALIAAVVTLLISNRITRPIRALSDFAEAIGRGEFAPREIACRDRELIELSDTMNHTAERLDKYDREQKTFFQNVSHELRTPLMSIRGYAEGIQVGVFDDDGGAAGVIIQASDQLTKLVEELLYLSKMDNITAQDEMLPLDLREVLSSCGEALRGVAIHEGKRIVYEFSEEPVVCVGAEKALERAFSNLITNALRYARETVTLRCRAECGQCVVRVEDDGPGIDEAELEKVFDRFYRGKGGKHGIGLSIVKAVVSAHGGEVRCENMERGVAFEVRVEAIHNSEYTVHRS